MKLIQKITEQSYLSVISFEEADDVIYISVSVNNTRPTFVCIWYDAVVFHMIQDNLSQYARLQRNHSRSLLLRVVQSFKFKIVLLDNYFLKSDKLFYLLVGQVLVVCQVLFNNSRNHVCWYASVKASYVKRNQVSWWGYCYRFYFVYQIISIPYPVVSFELNGPSYQFIHVLSPILSGCIDEINQRPDGNERFKGFRKTT